MPASTGPLPATQVLAASAVLSVQAAGTTQHVTLGNIALTLGRAANCDICLALRFVSSHHARIAPQGAAHTITDTNSTNGLLFEGQPLPVGVPFALHDGDVLRIGEAATGNFVTLTYRNPLVRRVTNTVRVRSYALNGRQVTTIGRGDNDIRLDNPQISCFHAAIEPVNGQHSLRDFGSTNGTFVNGQRITQHTLAPNDIIQIGVFKLVYAGDRLDEYDQRGALRLDAHRVGRTIPMQRGEKSILHDVSLAIRPCEFVALVGGSGAGKTTLLRALAGYTAPDAGQVRVNGDDLYTSFDAYRAALGYVPQEDTLHRELTVARALHYAALLRLPDDTDAAEIAERVERVLAEVELTHVRDVLISNVSGGQRKRVSIAAELLHDPSLFFLDEPTSGLDPGLEKKLMYTLRRLADSGRTVVLVTHATTNLAQCDHVAFLAEGRLVFFGPPAAALVFFGVTDFADVYTRLADDRPPTTNDGNATNEQRAVVGGQLSVVEQWQRQFRASPLYTRYVAARLAQPSAVPTTSTNIVTRRTLTTISVVRQWRILTQRYAELLRSDRRSLLLLVAQAPLIGALLALVSRRDALTGPNAFGSDARRLLVLLALVAVWLGVISAAREIAKETPIYRRERRANLRIGAYLASKVAVLGALVLVQSALLLGVVALRVQLPVWGALLPGALELYITTVLAGLAGLALGLALSAWAVTPDRAVALVPLALVPQILFAGVIFSLGGSYTAPRALSWFAASRWAMDAYGTTTNLNALPLQPGLTVLPLPPAEYTFTAAHLLTRWLTLVVYAAVCVGVAGWVLRRSVQT